MINFLYNIPFLVLEPPNLKLRRLSFSFPSTRTLFFIILISYFLVCAGIIYDIIIEPPSIGSTVENGYSKPVAFLPNRINGQYILEGLAASFLFTAGSLGFIILDLASEGTPKISKLLLTFLGFTSILVSFALSTLFMKMKLPHYLRTF
ncbi:unnamed protein product [Chironomus riparius]|uniref:Oligosaccharyltransferase complex subunit n=1 Tax=Chironomus riparius TaxID=315576 RepID=A0A9N9RYQ8_9DIPT|nr:unnamed protein product [Chironomus riparius]